MKGSRDWTMLKVAQSDADYLAHLPGGLIERNVKIRETASVAALAGQAIALTLSDLDAVDEGLRPDLASQISHNSIEVIRIASLGDGRVSGRVSSAIAAGNAELAVRAAEREHVKWLRRHTGQ